LRTLCPRFLTAGRIDPRDPLRLVARQSTMRQVRAKVKRGAVRLATAPLRSRLHDLPISATPPLVKVAGSLAQVGPNHLFTCLWIAYLDSLRASMALRTAAMSALPKPR
jgi:hypothetical protein